jgi:quercetin 2,3-dioxygenase
MSDASIPSPRDLLVTAGDRARLPERPFHHPLEPAAEIHAVDLGRRTGLRRVGVALSRVPAGRVSYAAHVHHGEEECLFVLAGRGVAQVGPETLELGPGDFVGFPPATHPHLVRNAGPDDLVYLNVGEALASEVVDFPAEGKQLVRRKGEARIYPLDAGAVIARTQKAPPPLPPPASLRICGADRGEETIVRHPLNPRSEIHGFLLSRRVGLERVGLNLARVPAGKESFLFHVHHSQEEFAYVLSGHGTAEIGEERFPVGAGDFLGFPPATHAHHLIAGGEDLVYLSGGENHAVEVADFPREGKRLVSMRGENVVYPIAGERPWGGVMSR